MKLVLQRVSEAKVEVDNQVIGSIQQGILILLGIHCRDERASIEYLVDKVLHLRIFEDSQGKMNRSLIDVQGGILVVSQFTLYADCQSGRRPSFTESAKADVALPLYDTFIATLKQALKDTACYIQTGLFGAHMKVSLTNDGPVTILLERN
jgi:D-tyrosyl-tRNA(Tyr) deacylase